MMTPEEKKIKNREQSRERRADPEYRARERAREKLRATARYADPTYKAKAHERYLKNREAKLANAKAYAKKHREKIKVYRAEYKKTPSYLASQVKANARRQEKFRTNPEARAKKHTYANAAARRENRDPLLWSKRAVARLRHQAKAKGVPFSLTQDDIKVSERCPVLGTPFIFDGHHRQGPSVDRIIPSLGYVRGNVCVISRRANGIKQDCTNPEELLAVARYMSAALS